jgi:hypothetical protein
MRAHLGGTAAGLLLLGTLIAGCGDDSADTASDRSEPASSSSSPSDQPSQKPVGVRKTCAELYRPPNQWMPLAIEFVHGSPSAAEASDAEAIVTGLAEVEGHSLGPLAEDIVIIRESVDAQRTAVETGSAAPDTKSFDTATQRLAGHCDLYND